MPVSQIKPITHALIQRVTAGIVLMGAPLLHAQNLVTNGGFESGLTPGWSHNASSPSAAITSLETAHPYKGTRALKRVITAVDPVDDWRVQTIGTTFTTIDATNSVTITFRARAATAGTRVRFGLEGGTGSSTSRQVFVLSTSWAFYTWTHSSTRTDPQMRIQFLDVGTVWLDEISLVINPAPGTATLISSNPSTRHQIMDGFGGSIAFNTPAYEALSATKKDEIENLLYVDCGVDILRLRTGNSDTLNNELAMRAQRNGAKSLLTCWSPPASLKSNGSITSGTLQVLGSGITATYNYAGFAEWWYQRLVASSWRHDFISIQNEPSFDPGNKETCRLFANETVPATLTGSASYKKALEAVYNRIKNEPKIPQFIAVDAHDHGSFNTIAPTVSGLSFVNHMGFHNYGSNNFTQVKNNYNGNRGWMTEWGQDKDQNDPNSIGIKEDWMLLATNIHDTLVGADASAYLAWRMVHGNNTGQVWAMIGVANGQYQVQNSFYVVKHFAKHISSGHQRFDVTKSGTNTNLRASGYINPAGNQLTLIVLNSGGTDDVVSLRFPGLPVASATSFRTRKFDIGSNPFAQLAVNLANNQTISKNSITTYVINLSETLNPYDPELLVVDWIQHYGDTVSLGMPIQPGQKFILWKSTNLAAGSWQKVTNAVFLESEDQLIITDPTPGATQAFYRVQRDTGL